MRFLGSLAHMDDSRVVCTGRRAPVFLLCALFVTLFYICTRFLRVIIGMLLCAYSVKLSECDSSLLVSVFGFLMFIITCVLSVVQSGLH